MVTQIFTPRQVSLIHAALVFGKFDVKIPISATVKATNIPVIITTTIDIVGERGTTQGQFTTGLWFSETQMSGASHLTQLTTMGAVGPTSTELSLAKSTQDTLSCSHTDLPMNNETVRLGERDIVCPPVRMGGRFLVVPESGGVILTESRLRGHREDARRTGQAGHKILNRRLTVLCPRPITGTTKTCNIVDGFR
ncbi:hypothetical protein K438DRAFT_1773460 [Mycena galopus ATCC 62051]|nr:hypothetical protein K438DRAFT_1773460 [Mycena galopus ATCC 62051]